MADLTASAADVPPRAQNTRSGSLTRRLQAVPLRWRLLGVTLGLIAIALTVTALVVSALLRVYLINQTEQELRVYAASLSSIEADELKRARTALPTGFTARIVNISTGHVDSLGEAVFEPNRAEIPRLKPTDPHVTEGKSFRVGSAGGDGEWLALAQLNEGRADIVVVALPLRPLQATVNQFLLYAALI